MLLADTAVNNRWADPVRIGDHLLLISGTKNGTKQQYTFDYNTGHIEQYGEYAPFQFEPQQKM